LIVVDKRVSIMVSFILILIALLNIRIAAFVAAAFLLVYGMMRLRKKKPETP
jgi:amino acid transporter